MTTVSMQTVTLLIWSMIPARVMSGTPNLFAASINPHGMRPTLCRSSTSRICGETISTRSLASVALELAGGAGGGSISVLSSSQPEYEFIMDKVSVEKAPMGEKHEEDTLRGGNATVVASVDPEQKAAVESSWMEESLQLGEKKSRQEKRIERRKRKQEMKSHKKYAKKLKNRNHLHLSRKIYHACFGIFFATLNQIIPRKRFLPGMAILTSSTLLIELLRYRKGFGWMNDILHFVLGGSLRKHEMDGKFTGAFYYFLGVTLTTYLYPQSCASLGIMQLALADPSASFFGRQTRHIYWSRIENGFYGVGRNKGFLGFLGGALVCVPFNFGSLSAAKYGGISNAFPGGRRSIALASIALGLAGSFADLCVPTPALTMPKKVCNVPVPPFHVDDNVIVPVFAGYACTKIFELLSWNEAVDLGKFLLF